jgi:ketosteroid isomerase-like protein
MQNDELITTFYTAFQRLDYKTMQECYHQEATFHDPVFGHLNAAETRAMWHMLAQNAKDFSLQFSDVEAQSDQGSCHWTAIYAFSKTGRKVVNHVRSRFRFKDGKIIDQRDQFDFWHWSRQALGLTGLLLGWSSFLRHKVHHEARHKLKHFMSTSNS